MKNIAVKLINAGANVNETNNCGATALIYAASFNRLSMVKLLLERGADHTIADIRGNTATLHAKIQGLKEILALLEKIY